MQGRRRPAAGAGGLDDLKAAADALGPRMRADRRQLHARPELAWQEAATTAFAAERMTALGYEVRAGFDFLPEDRRLGALPGPQYPTGCVADIGGHGEGPTVALRVDLDALPIEEAGDPAHLPAVEGWASSTPGKMHACGHDGHVAIGLAVAELVAARREQWPGRFRMVFQPAEEGTRGGRVVAAAGWVDDVDVLLALHIGLGVPSGTVALGVDGFLATRKYQVHYGGTSAHAGQAPQEGRNALLGACQAALALHTLAQSSEPGIRVNVGTLTAGTGLNIVPDRARFGFELRARKQAALEALDRRAAMVVAGTAEAHGLAHEHVLVGEAAAWSNGPEFAAWAREIAETVGVFAEHRMAHDFGASEDATMLLRRVVERGGCGGYVVLGADLKDGHHTPHFDFDESVMPAGAALMAGLALSALIGI